jgi:hypothetical protein
MNEKPRIVRSPEPEVRTAPVAEEFRRVAELVLGHALEGRDRLAEFGTAERAKSSPAQAGQTARVFSQMSGEVLKLTGRAIYVAREAYRGAVAQMQRLTGREDADTEADARETFEERALAEDAERKAGEAKLAASATIDEAAREVAEAGARAAAQKAAKRQTAEDAPLKAEEAARKAAEGKPKADAKEQAERAEAGLAQERARNQELEQQLAAGADERKLLVQERARNQELEQQLAARADEQNLLVQERARTQELEQQLSIRQNDQKLVAQERARNRELEQRLAARGDERKLLAHERARTQELEKQLSIGQSGRKLMAPETPGNLEAEPRPAEAPLPSAPGPLWQYKSKILVMSGVLLLLFAGAAGYAVFSSHSADTVASQTAAQAVAPPARSIAPVAVDPARVGARAAEEANRRDASAQRQAEEQRLADAAAAKAAEEEARLSAEPREADLGMTYSDRQKLQVALSSRGFDVGGIDGRFGPRTRQMIGAWQIKIGDISTGFFTAAQKKALLSEGAPAIAKWEDEQRRAIGVQYLPPLIGVALLSPDKGH